MVKEEKFTFWKEQNNWLGFLERFPDYWTQGESLEELNENLKDINEFLSLQITESV